MGCAQMDFGFSPEQQNFRAQVRTWLQTHLPVGWRDKFSGPYDAYEDARLRLQWERTLCGAGYHVVHWPREVGGQGLPYLYHLILNEELGRVGAPEPLNIAGLELSGPLILAAGTPEQQARWLPPIAAAQEMWCQGFTEPDAGSDLAAVKTTATRDGGGWVINGRKIWTSNAHVAQWCCLLARTDASVAKHKGLTVFAVPMDTPGISLTPLRQMDGRNDFCEVQFEQVRIPPDSAVGGVNDGWRVANESVAKERAISRMYRQARFQHEFEHIVHAAMMQPTGSDPRRRVIDNEAFRQRMARIQALLRIHRVHNLQTISRLDAGEEIGAESSFIKLLWSEMRQEIGQLGIDVLGIDALFADAPVPGAGRFQEVYFASRADTIFAGTVQIQRTVVAERLLGLPK
jgi:alkylation response protein AidB-like acyl-CoA dehydrogenase